MESRNAKGLVKMLAEAAVQNAWVNLGLPLRRSSSSELQHPGFRLADQPYGPNTRSSTSALHSSNRTASFFSKNDTIVPGNSTCAPLYEWEYYLDYLDPVFVDESQLKYHKYWKQAKYLLLIFKQQINTRISCLVLTMSRLVLIGHAGRDNDPMEVRELASHLQ
ncbi:hypothetical protein CCH79_00012126 [Gambusia affinis]|uniref:Uncharacterized protein n=1 Tax=Gambusia affinis TaxID=33528 RepID=A0A315VYI1_GAMAF|nr:hypothetical protein CCH79_00012126 [Gambusia affinis]